MYKVKEIVWGNAACIGFSKRVPLERCYVLGF